MEAKQADDDDERAPSLLIGLVIVMAIPTRNDGLVQQLAAWGGCSLEISGWRLGRAARIGGHVRALDSIAALLDVESKRLEPGRSESAQKTDVVRQLGSS
jgi:hypothetical protein